MTNEGLLEFNMLDIGSGNIPRGNVNIDLCRDGKYSKEIDNFIMADAMHLPFRNEVFNVVFSAYTIEQVKKPFLMLKEMCRVAQRKVIVRYPHRWSGKAKAPFHINYFDERWFQKAAAFLGFESIQFSNSIDRPISRRIGKIFPKNLQNTHLWRRLLHFERFLQRFFKIPLEGEAWIKKMENHLDSAEIKFVVVYNSPEIFKRCFASSTYVSSQKIIDHLNVDNEPLAKFYNETVQRYLSEETWFIFCHQDFILREDLTMRLKLKDSDSIYGPIGVQLTSSKFLGQIIQTTNEPVGVPLDKDAFVQTLDGQCLIAHASVFRQGLRFDERFRFHFYDADFCMQAYIMGFDVLAMQISCQHKSKTQSGEVDSTEYLTSLADFKEKWNHFLPIKTSTTIVNK